MGPWYYEVVSFDGDYVNLRRTDIASDELNPVALALLPPEIEVTNAIMIAFVYPFYLRDRLHFLFRHCVFSHLYHFK